MVKIPDKFVGLHSHSHFSLGDAIGSPKEHIDFAIKNGMDALALTDHGNMNGFSHQYIYAKELAKKGVNFKAIAGIEAYFIPSIDEWKELRAQRAEEKLLAKSEKSRKSLVKAAKDTITEVLPDLNTFADMALELELAAPSDKTVKKAKEDDDGENTLAGENEEESKTARWKDPLYQRSHLVLLPKNDAGLKGLFKMVSESFLHGQFIYPRVDFEMIKKYGGGNIIGLSACLGGYLSKIVYSGQTSEDHNEWVVDPNHPSFEEVQSKLAQAVYQFQEVMGKENYYAELQFNSLKAQHLVNMHLIECHKRTGVPLVVTVDAHYSNPEHWREREIHKAMAWMNRSKDQDMLSKIPDSIDQLKCELYPKNAQQVWESYKRYGKDYSFYDDQIVSEAIEKTHDIAHVQIGTVEPDRRVKLPAMARLVGEDRVNELVNLYSKDIDVNDEDELAFKELKDLAIEGLKRRGKFNKKEYVDRTIEELKVIKHLKFSKYFITYTKIMAIVGEHQILGTARGSAAGSLLCYALGITQVDPIRFGLLFSRFLVKNKKGYPDIDSDFSDREQAVKLIGKFFGEENVVAVSNFIQLQLRSLIKDVSKLYNVPFEEVNAYTGRIEKEARSAARRVPGFDAGTWVLTVEEAEKNSPSYREFVKKYPEFERIFKTLFKQMRGVSKHAGGVILAENGPASMPMIVANKSAQTPWPEGLNFRHLEEFGLLKFDILGLGTLRMFQECIKKILIRHHGIKNPSFAQIKEWFYKNLHADNNQFDDMNVYRNVYWNSNFIGVFQFVEKNTQEFIKKIKPTCINDISIVTAIFRPGPLGAGVHTMYLENRSNPKSIKYAHPLLEEVLGDTSGLLVYQEQLQLIYHKLAGVPLEETDAIRKAFTKKEQAGTEKAAKARQELCDQFILQCEKNNGIPAKVSQPIFDNMEKLVSYSFNKSHSISYSIISYQCAYLLTHYPDEWVTTYLDYCTTEKGKANGKEDPKVVAVGEAKKLGYTVTKPDLNYSDYDFALHVKEPKTIVSGFSSVANVGESALQEIERFRPYTKIEDLLINADGTWRHSKFNKRALSNLIKIEALDSLNVVGPDKPFRSYKEFHDIIIDNYDTLKKVSGKKKDNDAMKVLLELCEKKREEPVVEWTREERIAHSQELMGSVDMSLVVKQEVLDKLNKLQFSTIDEFLNSVEEIEMNLADSVEEPDYDDDEDKGRVYRHNCWAIVTSVFDIVSKSGKPFVKLKVHCGGSSHNVQVGWNCTSAQLGLKKDMIIGGIFEKNTKYGLSINKGQLKIINTNYKEG